MPNADSSQYTTMIKLRARSNDNTSVDPLKFRGNSSIGQLPLRINFSLTNFLPKITNGNHSLADTQRFSLSRKRLQRPY